MGQLVFQATLGGQVNLVGPNTASTFNINVPAVAGNMVTTGDTGTVSSTMLASGLTLAGSVTYSGGTANGVAYLNGSKVLTTGSALMFDGSNLGLGVTPSAKVDIYSTNNAFNALQVRYNGSNDAMGFGIANSNGFPYIGYNTKSQASSDTPVYERTAAATQLRMDNGAFKFSTAASGTAGNAISFTQAMTLDASGRLVVGNTSTVSKFEVNSGTNLGGLLIGFNGGSSNFYDADTQYFRTGNGTERARIDSSGNLLVGQTSQTSTEKFGVTNTGDTYVAYFKGGSAGQYSFGILNPVTSGNNLFQVFLTEGGSGTARGSITYNRGAGLVAYNVTSDYRAKDINGPVVNSGALIDSVPVYMGKMKGATQERPMFIAHEVPAYAHTGEKDAVDADGNPVYQQMDASALIPVMWAEIQSLRQRVASLEA
jgi:hypothetical protein